MPRSSIRSSKRTDAEEQVIPDDQGDHQSPMGRRPRASEQRMLC